ncbi:MAG: PQQ-dependent sugar dehydrogenase [Gemmatimonadaceae bacterium]|nr:PQQ-dependent sugar dehydrogenase [Acetobacteraceae bacterium]
MHKLTAAALLFPSVAWAQSGAPVPTGAPNVPEFKPAFAGQTRAPAVKTTTPLQVTTIASGLRSPWGLAFLPDGRMLVTEKSPPSLRIVERDGKVSAPVAGLPQAADKGQGGLLDVAIAPDFAQSRLVYITYAEPREGGSGTAVARGRLVDGQAPRLDQVESVFRMQPTLDSDKHFGARLVFAPDGKLFVALGERSDLPGRVQAQDLGSHFGKIVRVNRDGSVPADNPFVGRPGARPEIWSYGHRNIQGAALDAQGRLWVAEMGPQGGDEVNRPERGRDYGWPTIIYGEEYSGRPIGRAQTQAPGMEQPVYYWDPVTAPSGMVFYSGDLVPEWRGNAFIGGLVAKALVRLVMDGDRVVGEERLLTDLDARIRDVRQGPDGALYVLTDARDGKLLRVAPAG